MKNVFLFVFMSVSIFNISYANVNNQVRMMSPKNRQFLSESMIEVADAYQANGRNTKAKSFYRSALNVYPIGDRAHQIANNLDIALDDETTYRNFIQQATVAEQNKQYSVAIGNYLMANELRNSAELYQKISKTYSDLGNTEKAEYYSRLAHSLVQDSEEQ